LGSDGVDSMGAAVVAVAAVEVGLSASGFETCRRLFYLLLIRFDLEPINNVWVDLCSSHSPMGQLAIRDVDFLWWVNTLLD